MINTPLALAAGVAAAALLFLRCALIRGPGTRIHCLGRASTAGDTAQLASPAKGVEGSFRQRRLSVAPAHASQLDRSKSAETWPTGAEGLLPSNADAKVRDTTSVKARRRLEVSAGNDLTNGIDESTESATQRRSSADEAALLPLPQADEKNRRSSAPEIISHGELLQRRSGLVQALKQNAVFGTVSGAQLDLLCAKMQSLAVAPHQTVIRQGDEGDLYYVVKTGRFEVLLEQVGSEPVLEYGPFDGFGELALLYDTRRAATVRCGGGGGELWSLTRHEFREVLVRSGVTRTARVAGWLKTVRLFSPLTDAQRIRMAQSMEEVRFAPGTVVLREGEHAAAPNDGIYFVQEGVVEATKREAASAPAGGCGGTVSLRKLGLKVIAAGRFKGAQEDARARAAAGGSGDGGGGGGGGAGGTAGPASLVADGAASPPGTAPAAAAAAAAAAEVRGEEALELSFWEGQWLHRREESRRASKAAGPGAQPRFTLQPGDFFGEAAMLRGQDGAPLTRQATITAADAVTVLKLTCEQVEAMLGPVRDVLQRNLKLQLLDSVPLRACPSKALAELALAEREQLLDVLVERTYEDGEAILQEGDVSDENFYIVLSGDVAVSKELTTPAASRVAPKRTHSLATPVLVPSFPQGEAAALQPDSPESPGPSRDNSFKQPPFGCERQHSFVKEQMALATLGPGEFFGEMALMSSGEAQGGARQATVRACGRVVCLLLSREHFDRVRAAHRGVEVRLEAEVRARAAEIETREEEQLRFDDLELGKVLGVGSFGYVRIAVHRGGIATVADRVLALKAMKKAHIVKKRQVQHVVNERWVSQALDHPFLLRLLCTYQDDAHLYMLTEALRGGELFSLLCAQETFDLPTARFYLAQVVCGFEYLGSQLGVVYRDIKPENLMLDSEGYLRIVDFGFAKQVFSGQTFTLCGTPEYIAPEVVMNKGHGLACDWWGAGVFLFEMLSGGTPFAHPSMMEIYKRVVQRDFDMPAHVPPPASELIDALLETSAPKRLGCRQAGPAEVKQHAFFDGLSWAQLLGKQLDAPWVPELSSMEDTSNFDEYGADETPWAGEDLTTVELSKQVVRAFAEF